MFAQLLDAFIESSHLPPPPPTKKPLTIGVAFWTSKNALENLAHFQAWLFYGILATQHDTTLSTNPKDPCAVVFGSSLRLAGMLNSPILDSPKSV
ncbi:hypothetical protein NHP190003_00830 [Helicobacter sp. NHP19-003]|uniref:Uncharacterized protein n=1 Tax=Helicobacter gastrocanis TaxID=2849641 RepID=A0ABN6HZH2_9HELI|nr:hypothetical protein [Helicobacter sp. NHP19-003]BCZ16801.1 hypothetical protein NHP190003_00830 [Helicobacter sp. NHP19-003]